MNNELQPFDRLSDVLKSKVNRVKERIIKGEITVEKCPSFLNKAVDSPIDRIETLLQGRVSKVKERMSNDRALIEGKDLSMRETIDSKAIDLLTNTSAELMRNINDNRSGDSLVIRKICLLNKHKEELINPNEIINKRHKQVQEQAQSSKKSTKIFRASKHLFRSISKEIDKRTKQEFGLIKKSFNFMQYDNPFQACHSLNLNSIKNNRSLKSLHLPFLNMSASFLSKHLQDNFNSNQPKLPVNLSYSKEYSATPLINDDTKPVAIKKRNEGALNRHELRRESSLKKLACLSLNLA